MLDFVEGGKPKNPAKTLGSEQGREPTTNSTDIWRQLRDSNAGPHWREASAVITVLRHPCSPLMMRGDRDLPEQKGLNRFSL